MDSLKFKTFEQIKREAIQKHMVSGKIPINVKWTIDCPNDIKLDSGHISSGACLRCKNSPCIKFSDSEIKLNQLSKFPINTTCNLCPTNAIGWPYESTCPVINEELCIGCGLCASRCPAFAIYFKHTGVFAINDDTNDLFVLNKTTDDDEETNKTAAFLRKIRYENPIIQETDKVIVDIYKRVRNLMGDEPNLLTRNILIELGLQAGIRRAGDTNLRMDIIFEEPDKKIKGIGEIEFGLDILSTPRNSLDNIAVFTSRYAIKDVLPIVFLLMLPNQRSEYWQVIKDIESVLKIPIRTVTLGALLLFLWNRIKLSINIVSDLYSDVDNLSTRPIIEAVVGRKINISSGFLGIIEPKK